AVAEPAVAADLDQPFDVQVDLAAQVALDLVLAVDDLADSGQLLLGQVAHPRGRVDARLLTDLGGRGRTDPVDVAERDLNVLVARDVDAGDTSHSSLPTPASACASG